MMAPTVVARHLLQRCPNPLRTRSLGRRPQDGHPQFVPPPAAARTMCRPGCPPRRGPPLSAQYTFRVAAAAADYSEAVQKIAPCHHGGGCRRLLRAGSPIEHVTLSERAPPPAVLHGCRLRITTDLRSRVPRSSTLSCSGAWIPPWTHRERPARFSLKMDAAATMTLGTQSQTPMSWAPLFTEACPVTWVPGWKAVFALQAPRLPPHGALTFQALPLLDYCWALTRARHLDGWCQSPHTWRLPGLKCLRRQLPRKQIRRSSK